MAFDPNPSRPSGSTTPDYSGIVSAYQQYLGRAPENTQVEQQWSSDPNYAYDISQSPEALAYAAAQNPQNPASTASAASSSVNSAPTGGVPGQARGDPNNNPGNTAPPPPPPPSGGAPGDPTTWMLNQLNNVGGTGPVGGVGGGETGQTLVDTYNKTFGLQPGSSLALYGGGVNGSSIYALPNGYYALGPNGQWGWNARTEGGPSGGPSGGPNGGPGTGGPNGPTSSSTVPNNSAQNFPGGVSGGLVPDPNGTAQQLVNLLTQRAQQSLQINPLTDPIIQPQVTAAAATGVNQGRQYLNQLAESSNPYSTGAQVTATTQAAEQNAQSTQALQTQLVQQELTARRNDIMNAQQSMGSLLTADQQLALQKQLDEVNTSLAQEGVNLQQQGVTNQNAQFYAGLTQQEQQFLNNLALQYAGLNSQNSQFAANFGLNQGQMVNFWNYLYGGGSPPTSYPPGF